MFIFIIEFLVHEIALSLEILVVPYTHKKIGLFLNLLFTFNLIICLSCRGLTIQLCMLVLIVLNNMKMLENRYCIFINHTTWVPKL